MPRVAIVIVTHNSAAEIGACLDALASLPPGETEIVVVDNASTDATQSLVRDRAVCMIANPTNAGFAAALNQGVRATTARLVLSLNPDTHLVKGLDAMAECFGETSAEKIGAVGGMLIGDDNAPQRGFMVRNLPTPAALIFEVLGINRLWPRNPVNWHYRCLGLDHMRVSRVDQPAGAFLLFSRAAWQTVGGLDERFRPVWFEDVDFCARLRSAGYSVFFNPAGVARHAGSHSIHTLALENRAFYWYGNLLEYASKHYRPGAFRTTCVAVAVGAAFRAVWGFPRYSFKAFAVYGGISGHALRRAFHGPGGKAA
jgi:N-acetylglucosaminyl-diphospho-decaprenol L-rhamnosyltransferase